MTILLLADDASHAGWPGQLIRVDIFGTALGHKRANRLASGSPNPRHAGWPGQLIRVDIFGTALGHKRANRLASGSPNPRAGTRAP